MLTLNRDLLIGNLHPPMLIFSSNFKSFQPIGAFHIETICFAEQNKWMVSICNATLDWLGLNLTNSYKVLWIYSICSVSNMGNYQKDGSITSCWSRYEGISRVCLRYHIYIKESLFLKPIYREVTVEFLTSAGCLLFWGCKMKAFFSVPD